jgi:hypothetical protein
LMAAAAGALEDGSLGILGGADDDSVLRERWSGRSSGESTNAT